MQRSLGKHFKKISILLFLCAVTTFSTVGIACGADRPSVIQPPTTIVPVTISGTYDWSKVVTVGNHSYIPFHIAGTPEQHLTEILNILTAFESAHPEWEFPPGAWHIEKYHGGHSYNFIHGLWVDHQPRE
jgi:hypothetical protein